MSAFPRVPENTMEMRVVIVSRRRVASRHVSDTAPPHRRSQTMRTVLCVLKTSRTCGQGEYSKNRGSSSCSRKENGSTMGDLPFACLRGFELAAAAMTAVGAAGGKRAEGIGPGPRRRDVCPSRRRRDRLRPSGRCPSGAAPLRQPRASSPTTLAPGMGSRRHCGPTRWLGPSWGGREGVLLLFRVRC